MTGWLGALVGLGIGGGLIVVVLGAPPMRPVRLADRIAPYLTETAAPSSLLVRPGTGVRTGGVRRLLGPAIARWVRWLDRLVGGSESVRRRLGGLGSAATVEEFRVEQVVWGVLGLLGGTFLLTALTLLRGAVDPVLIAGAALLGGVGGVLGRDWWLSQQLTRRESAMLAEFPVIADLLALAVVAGEAPTDALQRVCQLTRGELTRDLRTALDDARTGTPITRALADLADRTTLDPFARFVQGLVVAIERGTPLAGVLRAQAADVRESAKRSLLEAGGRKELQMMVPVVFLILPVTVLFALYPGLLTLVSLAK
ncbi:MAG TPA: type II secretion system F family protein [Jatrophihabitans sp.]|nr:type II secretion system F family protein [Jatrophihabitans sp.]